MIAWGGTSRAGRLGWSGARRSAAQERTDVTDREAKVVIFREVRDGKPYPAHAMTARQWSQIPPRTVRLDQLITTKRELALDRLLADDSTFFGDLFPHVVQWQGRLYLEDGVHRALRAALQQRTSIHARVLVLPTGEPE